jgi:transposase-like protein
VPEFEKRWNRWARRVNSSWRVDETYISVRGKWHYLYRAVDKHGKTVDFLLRPDSGIAAGQAFFRKALATNSQRWPRKVTLDGHVPSHQALRLLRREDPKWKYVVVRSCRYLNNIVEQDHRAIKRRCAWMTGFKSFRNAAITLAGIELANRIRKRQFSFGLSRHSTRAARDASPQMLQQRCSKISGGSESQARPSDPTTPLWAAREASLLRGGAVVKWPERQRLLFVG